MAGGKLVVCPSGDTSQQHIATAASSSVTDCTGLARHPWGTTNKCRLSVQSPNINSSSVNDMFAVVAMIYQQIMQSPMGQSVEDTQRVVLNLMKQSGCKYITRTAEYDRRMTEQSFRQRGHLTTTKPQPCNSNKNLIFDPRRDMTRRMPGRLTDSRSRLLPVRNLMLHC